MTKDAQNRDLASEIPRPGKVSGPNVIRDHSPKASMQTPVDNSDPHYFFTEQEAIEYAKRFNLANGESE